MRNTGVCRIQSTTNQLKSWSSDVTEIVKAVGISQNGLISSPVCTHWYQLITFGLAALLSSLQERKCRRLIVSFKILQIGAICSALPLYLISQLLGTTCLRYIILFSVVGPLFNNMPRQKDLCAHIIKELHSKVIGISHEIRFRCCLKLGPRNKRILSNSSWRHPACESLGKFGFS